MRATTREAIETAAVRVFARRGFADSNMRQIAAEAGFSAGSIYRHYASKEELFESLLGQASDGLRATATHLSGDGDPLEQIRGFTEVFLADLANGEGAAEFFMVVHHGFATDTPVGTAGRLAVAQRELWDAVAALVRRGQRSGQFAAGDPARVTANYFALLTGLTMMSFALGDALPEPDIDLVLRTLRGGAER
ncbi:TetR/AcrR family transcriptional regulator [Agromyces lapidis]|uniref:TetR/AcrR family transcriptional regulator n=1 Tax=Agromyces lapidis TaxID=279574 RepID=A0ABV5SS58_9MICO|nr:TetR/AcrR family transcriptional regulator [Agromyces lapidis]